MREKLLFALLTVLALTLPLSTHQPPRHVDPAQVHEERPSPFGLLSLYMSVIDAVTDENFDEALERLKIVFKVYAPEDLRYVLFRFTGLLQEEVSYLNETDRRIERIRNLLNLGFLKEAENEANKGLRTLAKAELIHNYELTPASREFTHRMPIDLLPVLEPLKMIMEKYYNELKNLDLKVNETIEAGIEETTLQIWVDRSEAWVGSYLNVSGVLSSSQSGGLSGRQVTLHLGGAVIQTWTGEDGLFKRTLQIPYIYKSSIKLYAEYIPKASDTGLFMASRSRTIEIRLLYLKANLTASLDKDRAKPMEEFKISGLADPPDLKVWIEAFGLKRMVNSSPNGLFEAVLRVPSDASESVHKVKVRSEARGIISPRELVLKLEVYKLPLELKVYTPPLCLSGLSLKVSGSASSSGSPMRDVKVTIEGITGKIKTVTDDRGAFEAVISIPLNILSGNYVIKASASTGMPEYRTAHAIRRFTVVNPISAALPLALLLFLISRLKPRKVREEAVELEIPAEAPPQPGRETLLKGVPAVYAEAVKIVERHTGIEARPSYTVREYLEVVRPILGDASSPFEEISGMLEDELYGGLEVDLKEAYKALEILRGILIVH